MQELEELKALVKLEIPSFPKREVGFLEIINKSHHENINSSIFGYYLDPTNNREIADVFKSALLELIFPLSKKNFELNDYKCHLEYGTGNGRIDLVLIDEIEETVVLIENKVYASLQNDLVDYWNAFTYPEENKVGVYLTLIPEKLNVKGGENFVNITHLNWVNKIKEIKLPIDIPIRDQIYLQDFFNTITQLTNAYFMDNLTKFYFKNAKQIISATNAVKSANDFMDGQLNMLANKMNLSIYDKGGARSGNYRNIWDESKHSRTYYTIAFDDLMKGKESLIYVIIEMSHEDREYFSYLDSKIDFENRFTNLKRETAFHGDVTHFLHKSYVLTEPQVENLSETIYGFIESDFKLAMKEIQDLIALKKSVKSVNDVVEN